MQELTEADLRAMGYIEAIVARGKTVKADVPGTGRPSEDDPTRVTGVATKAYPPGSSIWLMPDEARRLRELGATLDPALDAEAIAALRAPAPSPDAPTRLEMRLPEAPQQLLFGRRDEVKNR